MHNLYLQLCFDRTQILTDKRETVCPRRYIGRTGSGWSRRRRRWRDVTSWNRRTIVHLAPNVGRRALQPSGTASGARTPTPISAPGERST